MFLIKKAKNETSQEVRKQRNNPNPIYEKCWKICSPSFSKTSCPGKRSCFGRSLKPTWSTKISCWTSWSWTIIFSSKSRKSSTKTSASLSNSWRTSKNEPNESHISSHHQEEHHHRYQRHQQIDSLISPPCHQEDKEEIRQEKHLSDEQSQPHQRFFTLQQRQSSHTNELLNRA